jgi:excisionase family DNA binding protein
MRASFREVTAMRLDQRDIDLIADAVAERLLARSREADLPARLASEADRTLPQRKLTVSEVAEQVGFGHQAVRRAIRRGELRAEKLCGRVRIEPLAVEEWCEANKLRSASFPTPAPARRAAEGGLRRLLDKREARA